jgi:D-serine deaminase-like pyridoxal phosphate-dependent protein
MTDEAPSDREPTSVENENLSAKGESRRRWMAASAAAVAGTWVACSEGGTSTDRCVDPWPPPEELPPFDAERCVSQIDPPAIPAQAARFEAWNAALRAQTPGRQVALVDLDAIDHNLRRVDAQLGSTVGLRLVAKSLPCVRLLEYMMVAACTNRIMAFSEGMARDLLLRFGSQVDILLGRPQTADAAARTFDALDLSGAGEPNPASRVRWLIDTEARMRAFEALAESRGAPVRVNVEIDVGIRRGGAIDEDELLSMLAVIDGSSLLEFAGFMGYDGHVPFAPEGIDPDAEFVAVQQRYQELVDAARDAYPALVGDAPLFNGGGSRTYHLYTDELESPINEVAMGSAFFYPENFSNLVDTELRTATYLASPVLKRVDPAELPFARGLLPAAAASDPNLEVSFHLDGAGYPADYVHPAGLVENPFNPPTPGVVNLLSNQPEWLGSRDLPLEVDDFVFYHPWEGDGVRWLSLLEVFRGGTWVDQWPTFQPGTSAGAS